MRHFVYNENNQVIGEYDIDGNMIAEYVYFGLRPVAVKTNGVLYAVHTDYLGTPRVVTTAVNGGSVVWQWKNDNPYGNNKAQGSIEFNLRFAGQYYDYESGLHYNMNRTYNPETGRYLQSDPIGLAGGLNTYNYVNKNPLDNVDPLGLIAGSTDPKIVSVNNNLVVGDGWITLVMHGAKNLTNSDGAFTLDYNSELYNAVKHTETFKDKLLGKAYVESTEYGNIIRYGVVPETMARMLKESGIVNEKTKGILVEACNYGRTTMNGKLNAQEFANELGLVVLAPTEFIYMDNGIITGSLSTTGVAAFEVGMGSLFLNESSAAMNVMKKFRPIK